MRNKLNWSDTVDWQLACRRAGGRRGDNAWRQMQALLRQRQMVNLLHRLDLGLTTRGAQSELARLLGVHRSTIHRDLATLRMEFWTARSRYRTYRR